MPKEILDHEELRAIAKDIAPDVFDANSPYVSVLDRRNCYPVIVPRMMELPLPKKIAFLDRLFGPKGANFPNHLDLIHVWARLEAANFFEPLDFKDSVELEITLKQAIKETTSEEPKIITGDWNKALSARKRSRAYIKPPSKSTKTEVEEATICFAESVADPIVTLSTAHFVPDIAKKDLINFTQYLTHATLYPKDFSPKTVRDLNTQLSIYELGLWPLGKRFDGKVMVYAPEGAYGE